MRIKLLVALLTLSLAGCSAAAASDTYRVRMDTTKGPVVVEVQRSLAPNGAKRFYELVKAHYFDGARFYRVVPGFVVQWGGAADPAVDALIDAIITAETRSALTTACRALDRVVRAGRYWIPQWYKASHWIAYWDVFGHPPEQPRYFRGIPDTWWYDAEKAAKVDRKG